MKANRVILWLALDEFPLKENDLPDELLKLKDYGLEICWCENLRSYKKLIPTLRLYPEADIATADDDLYYRRSWLEDLYREHIKHPDYLCAHRITKFYLDDEGCFRTIAGGWDIWPDGSFLNKLSGGAGTLFTPGILHRDAVKSEIFMKICTTNDDIWFWLMAVLNGVKILAVSSRFRHLKLAYVADTQKGPALCKVNDSGEKLFWKDFYRMLEYYPGLEKILRKSCIA